MASDPNEDIERNTTEVRQGTRNPQLVYYLAAGIVLVIVLFIIVWASTRGSHVPT